MSKSRYALIVLLVADGFDEAAVSLVLTILRRQGLAVQLVCLRARRVNGAHGLTVVPDHSLDRVLESSQPMLALIIPDGLGHLARLQADPRVGRLIQRAVTTDTLLVGLSRQAAGAITELAGIAPDALEILHPETEVELDEFANFLAQQLTGMQEG